MLPTKKTPPKSDLAEQTVLLHGLPKVGKSTWCSHAPGALFLACEPGLNSLEVYQAPITTWPEFLEACSEIAKGEHNFKTIVVDTVDACYLQCAQHICQKSQVDHESDLKWGKGSALINREFHRVLSKLAALPYGLFLVSHSQDREMETRLGSRTKTVPTLPNKAREVLLAMVDIILYCDVQVEEKDGKPIYRRVMRTKPSVNYEAGDRTGRLPDVLDLDWNAFVAAWNGSGPKAKAVPQAQKKEAAA